jgi:hypothetical protein
MGIGSSFKRAVKKITRPVAKVLDKVVPNEIKPALPYLAAFTPFMLPAGFGIGSLSPMVSRALASGAANLGSQLAQEGSEGDFSLGSVALASGIGALSTPGAGESLRAGIDTGTTAREAGIMAQSGVEPTVGFMQGAENIGREALAGSADFLSVEPGSGGIGDILRPGGTKAGLNMQTAKAAFTPFTQGTTDLALATARKALKDYEDELAAYEAETGEAQFASDEARRTAIRAAMIAGGHSDDVISETFDLLGLKDGGVVKMKDGGIMDLGGKEMDLRGGGFVPIGKKERADDVPARLSKNEFVMTADAVRAAGGGDINEGARRMYETMNKLEARA